MIHSKLTQKLMAIAIAAVAFFWLNESIGTPLCALDNDPSWMLPMPLIIILCVCYWFQKRLK